MHSEVNYEAVRQRNIERNRAFLETLGLDQINVQRLDNEKTRKRKVNKQKVADVTSSERRRSARIQQITTVEYDGSTIDGLDDEETELSLRKPKRARDNATHEGKLVRKSGKATAVSGSSNPASSRNLMANIELFTTEYLSRPVPAFGKAAVMDMAHADFTPSFNKFSGVVEWKNCLFLWVNVGGDDYENMFLDNGERLTWFGGSRMYADSPATLRLLNTRLDSKSTGSEQDTALLFCRRPGEPYTCLGRVACDTHELDKLPLRFTLRLIDFPQLCAEHRKAQFHQFLTAPTKESSTGT